jgi:Tol biopolymer transport system component
MGPTNFAFPTRRKCTYNNPVKRRVIISAFLVVWVILVAAGYLLSRPALVSVSPGDDQAMVSAGAPLRLEFKHVMQDEITSGDLQINPPVEGEFHWEDTTLVFTPEQGWPNRTAIQIQLQPGLRTSRWPWLAITAGQSWTFSVRPPLLLYLHPAGGPANIYLLDTSANEWQAQTGFTSGVLEFDVDPANGLIYYSRENGLGGTDIYRQPVQLPGADPADSARDLEQETQVTFCGSAACREPQLSPAGDFLAYERTSFDPASGAALIQVWVTGLEELSETSEDYLPGAIDHQTLNAAWGENGWLAFYNSTLREHTLINLFSRESISLQNEAGVRGVWTPQAEAFLTTVTAPSGDPALLPSGIEASLNQRIIRFDLAAQQARDLTRSARMDDAFPSPSPDGRWLAFARRDLDLAQWVPGRQVWLMTVETGEAHPLTSSATSDHFDFAWTPDSQELVFMRSDQAALVSPPEIWMVDPRFGLARRLVTGGFAPRWMP